MGVEYGYAGERRASLRGFVLGVLFSILTVAAVGGAVYGIALFWVRLGHDQAWVIAAGLGLCSAETTRHAVRWVSEHGAARSVLLERIEEIADTDEIVPLVGLAVLFAFVPTTTTTSVPLSPGAWLGVTAGVGIGLGGTCAMLIAGQRDGSEAWAVLLGAALLGVGIAWRLDISPLTVMFVMGIALSLFSRHSRALRGMLMRTESPVLLPTLLLGGALARFDAPGLGWIIAVALVSRTLIRWVLGYFLGWANGLTSRQRASLGFGMSSTGAVTMLIGLAFGFRFPGPVGNTVLCTAACMTALGELLGPSGLRRALVKSEPPPPPAASEEAVVSP